VHERRTDRPAFELVARTDDLEDRWLDDVAGNRRDRFVMLGIERAFGLDTLEAFVDENLVEVLVDELEAPHYRFAWIVFASRSESSLEIVDDRQQSLDDAEARAFDELGLLADDALAVVLEVGLQPLELVETIGGEV
jgi:hypothetical protein